MFSSTQRVSDIHYDIYSVDNNGKKIGSLAEDIGRPDIYASIGEDEKTFIVKQAPPMAHYIINIAGTGPQDGGVTDASKSGLIIIDVKVSPPIEPISTPTTTGQTTNATTTTNAIQIPSWVKNNAKYWNENSIDDATFAQGIQYMIKQGIITIPPTQSGQASPGVTIPTWVKNNAGYWATGDIDDNTFVKGIQYLITSGIIQVQ